MAALEEYLSTCWQVRSGGALEASYYPAIKALVDSAGRKLRPRVVYLATPKGHHGAFPDGALIPENHLPKSAQSALPFEDTKRKPERGVVEVKAVESDLNELVSSDQVARYLRSYGQVLATNLREFALLQLHNGTTVVVETYILAKSAQEFWNLAANPSEANRTHDKPLEEFLGRVLLATTTLASPADVAAHLASYAREARFALDLHQDIPDLIAVRETLEGALGVQFSGDRGEEFFSILSCPNSFLRPV